jgi:hypothetical protein
MKLKALNGYSWVFSNSTWLKAGPPERAQEGDPHPRLRGQEAIEVRGVAAERVMAGSRGLEEDGGAPALEDPDPAPEGRQLSALDVDLDEIDPVGLRQDVIESLDAYADGFDAIAAIAVPVEPAIPGAGAVDKELRLALSVSKCDLAHGDGRELAPEPGRLVGHGLEGHVSAAGRQSRHVRQSRTQMGADVEPVGFGAQEPRENPPDRGAFVEDSAQLRMSKPARERGQIAQLAHHGFGECPDEMALDALGYRAAGVARGVGRS